MKTTSRKPTALISVIAIVTFALTGPPAGKAQTIVFSDNFANGSTLNGLSTPGGTPTASSTSYDIASSKAAGNGPAISSGDLKLTLNSATTSGFLEAQALFTATPVTLTTVGSYVDLTYTFTDTGNLLAGGANSAIYTGLYNSGGSTPVAGLLNNSGLSATAGSPYATGNAANWQGYVASLRGTGGTPQNYSRPLQNGAGTSSANQELIGNNFGGGAFNNPASTATFSGGNATGISLTNGNQYTVDYRLTLSAAGVLTISNTLYIGVGTGGSVVSRQTATTTSTILANSFDALAIGARNSGTSFNPTMDISQIVIQQFTGTAFFGLPASQSAAYGSAVTLNGNVTSPGQVYPAQGETVSVTINGNTQNTTISDTTGDFSIVFQLSTMPASFTPYSIIYSYAGNNILTPATNASTTLTVAPPFSITNPPVSQTVVTGTNVTFTVGVSGTGPFAYQWQLNNTNLTDNAQTTGSQSNILTLNIVTPANAGTYRVIVTAPSGTSSASATLNVVAGGTWTALAHSPPEAVNTMLLLSDGTVMAAGADSENGWYRLTPDSTGSYVNGTWSTLAAMHDTRLYFSSDVLTDGRVFIAGAEYGTGTNSAEVYDPVGNTWTVTPPPPAGQSLFYDSVSKILPNGNVLISPVGPATTGGTVIYNSALNTWSTGPTLFRGYYQDEASWVKLPDNSILTIDPFGTNSERYIPALNQWINDANVPVAMYDPYGFELGGAFLLPDGRAFYLGATGNTAIYTPSGSTNVGSWQAGLVLPNSTATPDAPAAMMVNGNILCAVSPLPTSVEHFPSPTSFYEYNPVANAFTRADGPTGSTFSSPTYIMRMLDLPDGSVLLSVSGSQLYIYRPAGTPLAAGKPAIISITTNASGLFHLTGTLLNGISEGAAYGDDVQMDSNYPLIRMTNSANGKVYYARTFNWSRTSVMTGSAVVTTEFTPSAGLPLADYSLVVSANGNSSDPVPFLFSTSPPVVTLQPQSQTTTPGSSVTFSVAAAGGPLSYFWQGNSEFITGATNTTYIVDNVQLSDSGTQFSCLVSNVNSTALSSNAILTVLPGEPPTITLQPVSQTVSAGTSIAFSVAATSSVPISYFWQRNSFFISGATNSSYTAANVLQSGSGDQFSCLVSNRFGGTQSSNAVLAVLPPSLEKNSGFETGNFTNWTQSGDMDYTSVIGGDPLYVHSGVYGAQLGPPNSLGFLSQTLITTQGQSYLLSFWLSNPTDSPTPNQFLANWNGSAIFDRTNLATFGWTNLQFIVTATSGNAVLQFGFQNDPDYFGLDDIRVAPIPPAVFSSVTTTNNSVNFSWSAMSNLLYQVQFTTNLTQPGWINLGNPIIATNNTAGAMDHPGADAQRFYRLIIQP